MIGTKHIVECHCVLPQYRNRKIPIYHKFMVFSIIDDSDTVLPKYAQCNNCGVVHKIYDICKSEILAGKDEIRTLCTIEDISLTIPEDIRGVLDSYNSGTVCLGKLMTPDMCYMNLSSRARLSPIPLTGCAVELCGAPPRNPSSTPNNRVQAA